MDYGDKLAAAKRSLFTPPRWSLFTPPLTPIHTARFPSNWELSAGRATGVVRFFIDEGMQTHRLKAAGFAETRPKVPNRDAQGAPISENQAINRRVLIRVYPMSLDERDDMMRKVKLEEMISDEQQSGSEVISDER